MSKILQILLILLIFGSGSFANQNPIKNANTLLETDRLCYVSGDLVFLKIYHQPEATAIHEVAIYVDIINRDSVFVAGEILKLTNGLASGYIRIPDTVKTGYFSIRTYTYSTSKQKAQQILNSKKIYITNRFGNNAEQYHNDLNTNNSKIVDNVYEDGISNSFSELVLSDTIFTNRQNVKASLQLVGQNLPEIVSANISVKLLTGCEIQMDGLNENAKIATPTKTGSLPNSHQSQINESKGIIVSGIVKHALTGNPLANLVVLLAYEDSLSHIKYSFTDSLGKIKFLLTDIYENQNIYLSVYSFPSMKIYPNASISLDGKFLNPSNTKTLDREIKGYERSQDSLNVQKAIVAKAYGISYMEIPQIENRSEISYEQRFVAGKIYDNVFIDDYVELPNFIEITREILPFVRLRKKDNVFTFSIIDGVNSVIRENPILIVDGVPLTNINSILSWGTDKIKRIQVQIEPRYYGDIAFENGMILIWTRERDFWRKALDENVNTKVFSIQGFQKDVKFSFPDYSSQSNPNVPDFRQILYWQPNVDISNDRPFQFEFYTSDELGTYEIDIQGVTGENVPISIRKYIHVK